MYCANCKDEVKPVNGYCERCGTPLNVKLCPNGHIMDPMWTECQYCPPGARGRDAAGGQGAAGRTMLEPGSAPPPGGFTKGATLLDESAGAGLKGRTISEEPGLRGQTLPQSGLPGMGDKRKTKFDPGTPRTDTALDGPGGASVRPSPQAKLVGWLVTFSHDPAGADFQLREGRNTIGKDRAECEVHIDWDDTVSSKHAVIMYRERRFLIRDMDSTNGTFVNGEDIFGKESVFLQDRDAIRIGSSSFTLLIL